MRMRWLGLAVLFWLGAAGAANASAYDDFVKGHEALVGNDYPAAIAAMSRALGAGDLAPSYIPRAYDDRGVAYRATGDCPSALADAGKALALSPAYVDGHWLRGDALACLGRFAEAQDSYTAALALANRADLHQGRSIVRLAMGRLPDALADAVAAADLEPQDATVLIWLAIVRRRAGAANAYDLMQRDYRLLYPDWPRPIVEFYRGRASEADVRAAAANSPDARVRTDRTCDADLYLGEWRLANGDAAGARPLLQQTAAGCTAFYTLGLIAKLDLAGLH